MKCAGNDGKGERGERESPSPDTRGTLAYRDVPNQSRYNRSCPIRPQGAIQQLWTDLFD